MSPEVAVLVRAALVTLAVFALEAFHNARRKGHKAQRAEAARLSVRAYQSGQTQSQSSAPVIVQLKPLAKAPHPYDEKRAA